VKWLREGPSPYKTALAMIGPKPGQQVVVLGTGDGGLAAAIALVTGLNGRTLVVDPAPDARKQLDTAAAKAGALVDFDGAPLAMLPLDSDHFDIAVLQHALGNPADSAVLSEAARVVREGGRLLVIEDAPRPGLLGFLGRGKTPRADGGTVRDLLLTVGLRAARVLAESDGVMYVEAVKPRR
jgi:ubiquinone/menaquinone biosynthesis C-methylase UbiE